MRRFDLGVALEGGMGKMICASSCLPKLKEKYGKVVLVTPYPEVFLNNPHVARNFQFGHLYLNEDYLRDIPVIKQEPYTTNEYRLDKKHLIESYCKVFDIEYSEDMKPQIYLSPIEENEVLYYKKNIWKKFIVIQVTGGTTYLNPNQALCKITKTRDYDIKLAQSFVTMFKKKHPSIAVIQVGLPTEPKLQGVIQLPPIQARWLFPLMKHCESFLCIDSFMNHLSGAFEKRGVLLWGGTSPERLGYKHNINLVNKDWTCEQVHCHRPDLLYDNQNYALWECPHNYQCMNIRPEILLDAISKILQE